MTKAEMEAHRAEYHALASRARSAKQAGLYREAVDLAVSSWDHIDGMMRYERTYNDHEVNGLETIKIVLRHAPLLFDFESLDKLEGLLKTQRRIVKNTSDDLAESLAKARALMWEAHRLWSHLERRGECEQDGLHLALGGTPNDWGAITEIWERMALVRRVPDGGSFRVALATRMDALTSAKCPSCGVAVKGLKVKLLDKVTCPKCRTKVLFVLLPQDPSTKA